MGIEAITSARDTLQTTDATGRSQTRATSAASLDYNTFLKLLIAQMRNQDPTKPMDSTEQIAQLATFSQVEQTIQSNKKLETLIQSATISQASSLVGKSIDFHTNNISGVVKEVEITAYNEVIVVLEDGSRVYVERNAGMSIKDAFDG